MDVFSRQLDGIVTGDEVGQVDVGPLPPFADSARLLTLAASVTGLLPDVVRQAFTDTDDHGAAKSIAEALRDLLSSRGEFSDGDNACLPSAVAPSMDSAFPTAAKSHPVARAQRLQARRTLKRPSN